MRIQKRFGRQPIAATFVAIVCGVALFGTGCIPKSVDKITETAPDPTQKSVDGESDTAKKTVRLDPEGAKTAGIQTQSVTLQDVRQILTVSGIVEVSTDRVANVTPPVAGKIVRLLARIGESVTAGQPLLLLDSHEVAQARTAITDAEARIADAEATLRTAQADLVQTRTRGQNAVTARNTQARLARAGAFSEAPLEAARAELSDAQSDLIAAQTEQQSHASLYERTERLFKEGIVSKSELEAAQLDKAQDTGRVARASARVESVKQTLAREQRVAQGGLLNRQAVQAADAAVRDTEAETAKSTRQVEAARTALAGARQARESARANLQALIGAGQAPRSGGTVTVVAPISGTIATQSATLGEAVERTNTLFVVQNLRAVVVEAQVPEAEVARVSVGQRVEVTVAAFPKARFTGVVQSLASNVDEKTRTLTARCLVGNPQAQLRPEMFASVRIGTGAARRAVVIPMSALLAEDGKTFVFVRTNNGYEKREVASRVADAGSVEITSGLKAGEPVVTQGAYILRSESRKDELKEE